MFLLDDLLLLGGSALDGGLLLYGSSVEASKPSIPYGSGGSSRPYQKKVSKDKLQLIYKKFISKSFSVSSVAIITTLNSGDKLSFITYSYSRSDFKLTNNVINPSDLLITTKSNSKASIKLELKSIADSIEEEDFAMLLLI
jgi:hypothetical protein